MKKANYKYTVPQHLKRTENDIARFWAKIDRGNPDECWLWKGTKQAPNACGQVYGSFGVTLTDGRSVPYRAHRFAWILANGRLERGLVVMHLCDTPLCVNPAHLKAGTQAENLQDRDRKGRQLFGENHNMVKLTERQARSIRAAPKLISHATLAQEYGVHATTITKIRDGRLWKHLA